MTDALPDQARFDAAYAGTAPWDIGAPQPALVEIADELHGSMLDAGCGTGDNALFLAQRGHAVIGIDFLAEPIRRARLKAQQRQLSARFLVHDALRLAELPVALAGAVPADVGAPVPPRLLEPFDTVIDCGLFHVFGDIDRATYVAGLEAVIRPGGSLVVLCFSDREPGSHGPRRIAAAELEQSFSGRWRIESLTPIRFVVRTDIPDLDFTTGGPRAWRCVARFIP